MNIRQKTQLVAFVEHAFTIKNLEKDMVSVWDELKTDDKRCPIVDDHMTRVKAQCVQLYTRKLFTATKIIANFDMFPITQEDIRIGNWRIDSIVTQIASNKVNDHHHLFQLLMTNIFGVPTIMFEFITNGMQRKTLQEYLKVTYPLDSFEDGDETTVELEALKVELGLN